MVNAELLNGIMYRRVYEAMFVSMVHYVLGRCNFLWTRRPHKYMGMLQLLHWIVKWYTIQLCIQISFIPFLKVEK
jgi:hypothetical protein